MDEDEHQNLMVWLEEFLSIAMRKTYGYEDFMKWPYLKLCNDTFSELLLISIFNEEEPKKLTDPFEKFMDEEARKNENRPS